MVSLMNAEQSQEVRRDLLGGRTGAALPKQRVEIIRLAEQRAFARVEALRNGLEVQQAARQLEVGVRYAAVGVRRSHEVVDDVLRPF